MEQEEGQVTSLNYPNSYPNNLDFTIQITSPNISNSTSPILEGKMNRQVIVIWLEVLDIEYQESCLYDYIEIKESATRNMVQSDETASVEDISEGNEPYVDSGDEGEEVFEEAKVKLNTHSNRICGKIQGTKGLLSRVYFTSSNQVSVRFHSDRSNRGSGFLLKWQSLDVSLCSTWLVFSPKNSSSSPLFMERLAQKDGDVTVVEQSGSIESPGYPNWLIPSLNCSTRLIAPPGFKVRTRETKLSICALIYERLTRNREALILIAFSISQ